MKRNRLMSIMAGIALLGTAVFTLQDTNAWASTAGGSATVTVTPSIKQATKVITTCVPNIETIPRAYATIGTVTADSGWGPQNKTIKATATSSVAAAADGYCSWKLGILV